MNKKQKRKKLYRSTQDEIIAGIFGGLGEYLDVDSNFLRLVGLLVCILTGLIPFTLFYLIAYFIIPTEEMIVEEDMPRSSVGELFIPAGGLMGMGVGLFFNDLLAGFLIGFGVGFFLYGIYEIFKKHSQN